MTPCENLAVRLTYDPWGVVLRVALAVGALAALLQATGCGAAWPKDHCAISTDADGVRRWHCAFAVCKPVIDRHPALPPPAGVVWFDCDGARLPVDFHAKDVGVPRCQP